MFIGHYGLGFACKRAAPRGTTQRLTGRFRVLTLDEGRLRTANCELLTAHAAGVIHRDLKPANVVLMADGRVKILDFGLARMREIEAEKDADDRIADAGSSSRAHRLAGTPGYMAPEQLLGKPVTPLTDVYALGVLLFELLSGRRPFAGTNFMALGMAVLIDRPPELPMDAARPDEVGRIVARAMAKEPAERPRRATRPLPLRHHRQSRLGRRVSHRPGDPDQTVRAVTSS